jgi:hypothetical protein
LVVSKQHFIFAVANQNKVQWKTASKLPRLKPVHGYCKKEAPSLGPLGGGGIFAILEAARCGF